MGGLANVVSEEIIIASLSLKKVVKEQWKFLEGVNWDYGEEVLANGQEV